MDILITIHTDPLINAVCDAASQSPLFKEQVEKLIMDKEFFYMETATPFCVVNHLSDKALDAFHKFKGV